MTAIEVTKQRIRALYEQNPHVHISVSINASKIHLTNEPVRITGVYPHIFQIEERSSGAPKNLTLQYTDVLTDNVKIAELE